MLRIQFIFIFLLYSFLFDIPLAASESEVDTTTVTKNVSFFPKKTDVVNGLCLTTNHGKPRLVNGLNIEIPGSRSVEYYYFLLRRDMSLERFATVNGLTIGIQTMYYHMNGVNISLIGTEIQKVRGVTIGATNGTHETRGVQIGVFNYSTSGRLVQIGLFNTIEDNPRFLRTLPVLNFRFPKDEKSNEDE